MSISKRLFGALSLSLLAVGIYLPAQAQTTATATPAADRNILNESKAVANTEAAFPNGVAADSTVEPELMLIEQPELFANGFSLDDLRTEPEAAKAPESTTEITSESAPELAPEVALTDTTFTETPLEIEAIQPATEASDLAYPAVEEPTDVAQSRPRRRTTGARGGSNFIGIGADIGYADDFSFAAISKFEFTDQVAIRPSVLIGDDFSILVPVTYDFNRFDTNLGGFQLSPYAGVGAAYTSSDNDDDDDDINLLLSAGVDVPLSQRFTANAQVNWGVLNDSNFGVTLGVGYNLGNFFR